MYLFCDIGSSGFQRTAAAPAELLRLRHRNPDSPEKQRQDADEPVTSV